MAKHSVPPRPVVRDGLIVLGQLIRVGRHDRNLTAADLARQANVSERTVLAVESGSPGAAVGTVFTLAYLAGVPIFGIEDRAELAIRRRQGEEKLALLPSRVYVKRGEEDDDDGDF